MENSHCPSNPNLSGKRWTLNDNDDHDDDECCFVVLDFA